MIKDIRSDDMNVNIVAILDEKLEILKSFELITKSMMRCDESDFTNLIERRQELIDQIDILDKKMWSCIEEGSEEEKAMQHKINRGQLSGDTIGIYDQSNTIISLVARIIKIEPEVLKRMDGYKQGLSEDVRRVNNVPKIARYFSESTNTQSVGFGTI